MKEYLFYSVTLLYKSDTWGVWFAKKCLLPEISCCSSKHRQSAKRPSILCGYFQQYYVFNSEV